MKKIRAIFLLVLTMGCAIYCTACTSNKRQVELEGLGDYTLDSLSYADQFSVKKYDTGYTLLEVTDGSSYLVVPEQMDVPAKLPASVTVIKQPVEQIYLTATAAMDMFIKLESLDQIALSGTKADGWYLPEAVSYMDEGKILYAGKYSEPDYELILRQGCQLCVENTMLLHTPEVKEKLEALGLPVVMDYASYEKHPLGRMEWIKFYGYLLGKEDLAAKVFEEQISQVEDWDSKAIEKKSVAIFYFTSNGSVSMRKEDDYFAKMSTLAGGNFVGPQAVEDNHSSSTTVSTEAFYQMAKDVDILIYTSSISGEVSSLDELCKEQSILSDFTAVKNGQVYCTTKSLYQSTMELGTMVKELHDLIIGEGQDMTYFYKIEK